MGSAADVLGAVAEIFTWAGLGLGVLVAGFALVLLVVDGTWLPASGVVETEGDDLVVRWWDEDGDVNQAALSHQDREKLAGRDMLDIFYRRGYRNRMRLTRASPAVRAFFLLALGLAGVGLIAVIGSWVLLFIEG